MIAIDWAWIADHLDELVARALRPGSDGRFDTEYRTVGIEDGKERWVAAKGLVIFDLAGDGWFWSTA